MGGEVGVDSEEGKGSTFYFSARFGLDSPVMSDTVDRTKNLRGLRTLIVDDNATNRRILGELVRSSGLRALTVPGVDGALEELRRAIRRGDPVQLVLSDVQMPEADGFELARAVNDDPAFGHPPIVLLTSGGLPDAATADAASVAASLFKRVKHSELLETIQAVMGVAPAVAPAGNATASPLAPLDVLLAEDSLANQRLAVGTLEKHGHRVTVVGTGTEAVDACMAQPFDVVVMDLQMPEMDGFEAVRAIRQRERETHTVPTPIVALTARAMADDEALCRRAGFDGYLAKPFRSQQLYDALASVVPSRPAVRRDEPEPARADGRLDWAAAVDAVEGDRVLLGKVVRSFLDQYPSLVAELETSLDASDLPAVQRVAHTLGGSLRMFDRARVVELARLLESVCRMACAMRRRRRGACCRQSSMLSSLSSAALRSRQRRETSVAHILVVDDAAAKVERVKEDGAKELSMPPGSTPGRVISLANDRRALAPYPRLSTPSADPGRDRPRRRRSPADLPACATELRGTLPRLPRADYDNGLVVTRIRAALLEPLSRIADESREVPRWRCGMGGHHGVNA